MFQQALPYLEEAAKNANYAAVLDLANCKKKLDRNFDYIQHFKMMLIKHKLQANCKQQILLHIGMHYYNKNDYINAAKYLLEAIEFNIDSCQLTVRKILFRKFQNSIEMRLSQSKKST